jgi:hypothetical protein
MHRSYQLVNPIIEGTMDVAYDAKKPIDAADKFWKNISQYTISNVPHFKFTFKNITNGEYHNFEISENENGQYKIKEFDIDNSDRINTFQNDVISHKKKTEQLGGSKDKKRRKRYSNSSDSSSSDSDSDSSNLKYPNVKRTSPVGVFYYNTTMYYDNNSVSTLNPRVVAVPTVPVIVSKPVFTPIYTPVFNPINRTRVIIF